MTGIFHLQQPPELNETLKGIERDAVRSAKTSPPKAEMKILYGKVFYFLKEVSQGSQAATKINRNARKVNFSQITPIIAEND
ncbi:hypothetical protein ACX8XP_18185 [Calditrichota bacterium LG25]